MTKRGGEWSLKKFGSRKILVEFRGSHSLMFSSSSYVSQSQFFRKTVLESRPQSRNLKSQVSESQKKKTLVSPSHKVSNLPFATPTNAWPGVKLVIAISGMTKIGLESNLPVNIVSANT